MLWGRVMAWCVVAAVAAGATLNAEAQTRRILVVGDSWAMSICVPNRDNFPTVDTFDSVLADYGFGAYMTEGGVTAYGGRKASWWVMNLSTIQSQLDAYPEIDLVHLILGGNDFLAAAGDGDGEGIDLTVTDASTRRAVYWQPIVDDVETIIRACLSARPDIKLVLADYEYLDLASMQHHPVMSAAYDFHGATQEQVNTWFAELGAMRLDLVRALNAEPALAGRVGYVQNWGALQYAYRFLYAEEVPYPGGPDMDWQPYPGGLLAFGMPAYAHFGDGVHPTPEMHYAMLINAMEQYYVEWLDGIAPELLFDPPAARVEVDCGETYSLPEVSASDNIEGDISGRVERYGETPDTRFPGEYALLYSVADSAGNTAEAALTVTVLDNCPGLADCTNSSGGVYEAGENLCITLPETVPVSGSYRWHRDGLPLEEGGRAWGTRTRTLSVYALVPEDTGDYLCTDGDTKAALHGPVHIVVGESLPVTGGLGTAVLALVLAGAGALRQRRRRQM